MKVLVLGYIIRGPYGGLCFHHLQYILGLKKLGYQVLFFEDSDDHPEYNNTLSLETALYSGFDFIEHLFNYYDLNNQWSFFDSNSNTWYGLSKEKVFSFCAKADIALNLSGVNPMREWWAKIPIKIFVDTDPTFTQIKHLTDLKKNELAAEHNCHFSFAENINKDFSQIPQDDFHWLPTRQPVVLDIWGNVNFNHSGKWTTVMQWDSYKMHKYNGQEYGMKSDSFIEYLELPKKIDETFELAIKADAATLSLLEDSGWQTIPSLIPTKNSFSYQQYILESKGEWSVAKHGYVISKSGWFSERSLSYMASSKPVVVQDTGFSDFLPVGEGLLCFFNMDEAIEQIQRVMKDYKSHCIMARKIVEENFEAGKVIKSLIQNAI